MKTTFLGLSALVFLVLHVSAQDTTDVEKPWKFTGFFQQNLNQVSFTNWAA